jgi:predicted nucleic-acid-binding Zn-ribbon protein
MALSSCVKCGNTVFEVQEKTPVGSNFKFIFVQCSQCGGVVGVMDFYNIGEVLTKIGRKIGVNID